ncbi:MAG: hypothetical protein MJZ13_07810 [Bacteroidales bacterium]|nr:hypothetical protein [Bacteroidales bacterium]
MRYLLLLSVCFYLISAEAQSNKESDSQDVLMSLLNKCIRKGNIYSHGNFPKSYFDDVKLTPVTLCNIVNDSAVTDSLSVPYLVIISKVNEVVGVISTDDYGNSYIDMEYNYHFADGLRVLWPIWVLLHIDDDISVYNAKGVDDQVIFVSDGNTLKYLDMRFIELEYDELPQDVTIENFGFKDIYDTPSCGFPSSFWKRNTRRRLKHAEDSIGY